MHARATLALATRDWWRRATLVSCYRQVRFYHSSIVCYFCDCQLVHQLKVLGVFPTLVHARVRPDLEPEGLVLIEIACVLPRSTHHCVATLGRLDLHRYLVQHVLSDLGVKIWHFFHFVRLWENLTNSVLQFPGLLLDLYIWGGPHLVLSVIPILVLFCYRSSRHCNIVIVKIEIFCQ